MVGTGGRRALYGNLTHISIAPITDFYASGGFMLGMGLTMEAIEQVGPRTRLAEFLLRAKS
jgi:hypothetical protein